MNTRKSQLGMVLVTSLLLLIVVTILAVGLFRSFGLDEKIAGNVREKQRALNAAETAEQYAESWLSAGNGNTGIPCTALVDASIGQVCSNTLQLSGINPMNLPWTIAGNPVGVTYLPLTPTPMNVVTQGAGFYFGTPTFYIAYLGPTPGGLGTVYQIDAAGYASSPNTAAVVESTYLVQTGVKDLGGL
jgi:type IV pilus assembly protein PilX